MSRPLYHLRQTKNFNTLLDVLFLHKYIHSSAYSDHAATVSYYLHSSPYPMLC